MQAAILQCDRIPEELHGQFIDYADMIAQMLTNFDSSIKTHIFDVQQGHYPDDLSLYDFYITTGSRTDAYVSQPWVDHLKKFIQQLDQKKLKLIGICFGHQIIAEALGGKVENSNKGWGLGVAINRVVATPAWLQETRQELKIIVSHQDQVVSLCEGAVRIVESDFCPNFMVQWNDHFLSIQGHPEWQTDYSHALMELRRGLITDQCIDQGIASLIHQPDNDVLMRWFMHFIQH